MWETRCFRESERSLCGGRPMSHCRPVVGSPLSVKCSPFSQMLCHSKWDCWYGSAHGVLEAVGETHSNVQSPRCECSFDFGLPQLWPKHSSRQTRNPIMSSLVPVRWSTQSNIPKTSEATSSSVPAERFFQKPTSKWFGCGCQPSLMTTFNLTIQTALRRARDPLMEPSNHSPSDHHDHWPYSSERRSACPLLPSR